MDPTARPGGDNRLAREKSPYLQQHRTNPVDWYPWGEEALARARREDRPLFLSIGYSTCHWCHVMARESFADAAVARLLNADYVAVKVDREERPDIDHLYMTACHRMTGSGGWPLTLVLTPDGHPFFAGTYIPREARYGRPGMLELLPRLTALWRTERGRMVEAGREVMEAVRRAMEAPPGAPPSAGDLDRGFQGLSRFYDPRHGGFGGGAKFPTPHNLTFLLRYHRRTGNSEALEMALRTLDAMAAGGISDHLEGGFHRYATDPAWRLPHFEKMLYDQALVADAFLEAFEVAGEPRHAAVARRVFGYVRSRLTTPDGAFYAAEDAESEGEEGRFYLWSWEELAESLTPAELTRAQALFGVAPEGNFTDPVHPDAPRRNVLFRPRPDSDVDGAEALRGRLLELRSRRPRPHRDEKVLADWNGLMVGALARGAVVLGEVDLARRAGRAADFILEEMVAPDGGLLHRWYRGEAAIDGMLDDYAFLLHGLVELHRATGDPERLAAALRLADAMEERFRDERQGGYFLAPASARLAARPRELYDGALPSGNAVAAEALLRLGRLAARPDLDARAGRILAACHHRFRHSAESHTRALQAAAMALDAAKTP